MSSILLYKLQCYIEILTTAKSRILATVKDLVFSHVKFENTILQPMKIRDSNKTDKSQCFLYLMTSLFFRLPFFLRTRN